MLKNTRWFTSIRFKLIIPIALIFIVLVIFNTFLLTRESIAGTDQILKELRNESVLRVSNTLDGKLEQAIKLNELHAANYKNGILRLENSQNRESYFSAILKPYSDVAMTFIGLPDGSFYGARRLQDDTIQIVRNNAQTFGHSEYYDIDALGNGVSLAQVYKDFDARTRPWYKVALDKKEVSFSDLYSHFVFKVPTITASLPYYEDDELIGVFGVDFLMTWLADTLSEIPVGEHGTVFIVDSKDQLVATSTHEEILKIVDKKAINISANESKNPIIQKVSTVEFTDNQSTSIEIEGKSYLVGKQTINSYGIHWSVYIVIDKTDYTGGLMAAINRMIVVGLMVTLLFLIVIVYSNHKFTEPILALNKHAKMLTEGSFEEVKTYKHSPEMETLITSFNVMGNKIQSYVDDLEREVQLQTKMYEDSALEAQSANIAKSRFLAMMSHELRTPLTGILGMVELLKTTKLDEEQQSYLNLAEHTSQTLLQLINGVLDYSKIEAQQVELEHLPFEIKDLTQDVVGMSNLYVKSKGLDFELNVDHDIPVHLVSDRFRLRQILTNLIANAVKFTKVGKITVSIELLEMDEETHEALLCFSVKDTGIGISLKQQEDLFEPFSQADVSTTREFGGTGLGLAICKNLVELMNGHLNVASDLGVGSTFSFTCRVGFLSTKDLDFPNLDSTLQDNSMSSSWKKDILDMHLNILLVEDSKANYEFIKKLAEKSNWKLFHAINGEEGISLYTELKAQLDLVIMDIEMPILDGIEATKRIRKIESECQTAPVNILAFSANVLVGEPEKCFEAGMNAYLSKPFRIEQLLAQMQNLINNKK